MFRRHLVRDLQWAFAGTPLLQTQDLIPLFPPDVIDEVLEAKSTKQWLRSLDEDTTPVIEFLTGFPNYMRLGYYFSLLVEYWFRCCPALEPARLLTKCNFTNQHARFLVQLRSEGIHVEASIHYTVAPKAATERQVISARYSGAILYESLAWRLFDYRRKLCPSASIHDAMRHDLELSEQMPLKHVLLLRGAIFYPLAEWEQERDYEALNSRCEKGWWGQDAAEVTDVLPATHYALLDHKRFWLSEAVAQYDSNGDLIMLGEDELNLPSLAVFPASQLAEKVDKYKFQIRQNPVMVSAFVVRPGEQFILQHSKGMMIPAKWDMEADAQVTQKLRMNDEFSADEDPTSHTQVQKMIAADLHGGDGPILESLFADVGKMDLRVQAVSLQRSMMSQNTQTYPEPTEPLLWLPGESIPALIDLVKQRLLAVSDILKAKAPGAKKAELQATKRAQNAALYVFHQHGKPYRLVLDVLVTLASEETSHSTSRMVGHWFLDLLRTWLAKKAAIANRNGELWEQRCRSVIERMLDATGGDVGEHKVDIAEEQEKLAELGRRVLVSGGLCLRLVGRALDLYHVSIPLSDDEVKKLCDAKEYVFLSACGHAVPTRPNPNASKGQKTPRPIVDFTRQHFEFAHLPRDVLIVDNMESIDEWDIPEAPIVGVDCEWTDDVLVALAQVAIASTVFLVDLTVPDVALLGKAKRLLSQLLTTHTVVGFGVKEDLRRLALMGVDVPSTPAHVVSMRGSSLSNLAAKWIHRKVDKTYQCSDWARRPLLPEQRAYAALDAWILLPIFLATKDQKYVSMEWTAEDVAYRICTLAAAEEPE